MRILFLHLSDLHIENELGLNLPRVQSLVQSLQGLDHVDGIVIAISGDLARNGKRDEYRLVSLFVDCLLMKITDSYALDSKDIKILLIPGNHDIDWGDSRSINPASIRQLSNLGFHSAYQAELEKMDSFFWYSNKHGCFNMSRFQREENQVFTRKILHFSSGYRIEANLINTAPFSCENDDGLHYLPPTALYEFSKPSNADLALVMMHHSPDWFPFDMKKQICQSINERCSLAFYGHDHVPGSEVIISDSGFRTIKQSGGAWQDKSVPSHCEVYVGLLDTEAREYTLKKHHWSQEEMAFMSTLCLQTALARKPVNGSRLIYREEYLTELLEDKRYSISPSILDYFVFQGVKTDSDKEYAHGHSINRMEELVDFAKENRYIAITGESRSGKTTILKALFVELLKEYTVLFCDTSIISGRKQSNVIKELVESTFGDNKYDEFCSIPFGKRALIIDDIHLIKQTHLDKFLRGLESIFDLIIVSSCPPSQFDIVQLVKDRINAQREFRKVSISKLFAAKRLELIGNIARLKTDLTDNGLKDLTRSLDQYLNSYKLAFRTEIDFVVQFTSYFCEHIKELDRTDASVFSTVFEASIERLISPQLYGRLENVEDLIVAFSEVAHYIHFHKVYPISSERISEVISGYCEYYDNRYLTPARFLEIAVGSGILKITADGFQYKFSNRNHLAYFVAKALNRKYYDDGDETNLRTVLEQSCFGINADILSFLTYISDNVRIPRLMLSQALACAENWVEFDLNGKDIKYLKAIPVQPIKPPAVNQRETELEQRSESEEMALRNNDILESLDIYDYDPSKIDEIANQLLRSFLQLQIISRNFSAFMSILTAKDRQAFVSAMYQLPNRIFYRWAKFVDDNFDALLDELMAWQEEESYKGRRYSRDRLRDEIQKLSTNQLLNLYYVVAVYGTNNATAEYIASQEYIDDSLNYRIQRLLVYEKVDNVQPAVKEAEEIYKGNEDGMVRNLINSFFNHLLINSNRISDGERRRITGKYFSPEGQTRVLLGRRKASKL